MTPGKSIRNILTGLFALLTLMTVTAQAQQVVNIRYADHPGFSRIVFDWEENVPYSAEINGSKLLITFQKKAIPSWGKLSNNPLKYLANPEYRIVGESLIVSLRITGPARLKDFRDGTKVAFDLIESQPVSLSQTNQSEPVTNSKTPTVVAEKLVAESVIAENISLNTNIMKLQVRRNGDSIRLSYPWQNDVLAAVFIRYNRLWVVFDHKVTLDQKNLDRYIGQRILSGQQINNPSMTILTYEVAPGQNVRAQKINTQWHIDLKNTRIVPAIPIQSGHQRAAKNKGENFFFSVEDTGPVLIVEDPVIGDEIAIIPVMESSQGLLNTQKFPEFEALATAQGIAIQLISDKIEILKYRNGISISAQNGLAISKSQLSSSLGTTPIGEVGDSTEKLIDFPLWAKGPLEGEDYHANKHELLYRLSLATDDDRNELRWHIARFYLANGRTREAYGVLQVMLSDDPDLIENPEFRAVLGVTNILMRRFKEGAKLLVHKTLIAEQDTFLWGAVANSALGKDKTALDDFKRGADILSLHEPRNRIRFLFAALRSAYNLKDNNFVETALSLLKKLPLTAAQFTEVDYWESKMAQEKGNPLKAEEILLSVAKAGVRQTAAWAKLDLINLDYQNKKIDAVQAVDRLEKLRFAWRGDDFELELLSRLGDLYVEQKEYNIGLQTLRLAVTFFDGSPKTAALTRQMNRIYSDLFLNGEADVMEPVKAVALYSEFRELIPLGTDGDKMTRRLADRLVSIDLLTEASELLEYQIKYRLKGVAQSVVAGRLAMVYLLNAKPEKALGILRATRDSQIPQDIEDRRLMIEARALVELERYEEAEVLIDSYQTPEAHELRADIYWKSDNWAKYISHGNKMLGKRYLDETPLSPKERLAVLRLSAAYIINDDKAGVKTLRDRYKAHMDNGLYGDTFEVITAERQLTDLNVRRLTKSIASVAKLETFMQSYKAEFASGLDSGMVQN